MKSTNYSDKVLDHFKSPRNVGTLEGPNVAMGRVGNPVCGDLMEIYIKVDEKDTIEEVKFKTFGCGSAVATSSMITEMVLGMTLDDALKVSKKDVAEELDGLPPIKMHCSNLAADALHAAIHSYRGEEVELPGVVDPEDPDGGNVEGEEDYLGKGVFNEVDDPSTLASYRVIVVNQGPDSVNFAIELTQHTGRVILLNSFKKIYTSDKLRKKLSRSDVKVINEAKLLKIMGEGEVEKVKIHDLDEDEDYELFIDAVVILQSDKDRKTCHDD